MIDKVNAEKATLLSNEEGALDKLRKLFGSSSDADRAMTNFEMKKVWDADEDIRSLKSLILFGMRGMAAYAYHALMLGQHDDSVDAFFLKGLRSLGEDLKMEELLPIVLETGTVNLTCMEMLDRANTTTYGTPVPTEVPLTIEKGPFIVVTGHDLKDLELLLKQTEGKGVNIYTHGEMLPAHGYPELKNTNILRAISVRLGKINKRNLPTFPRLFPLHDELPYARSPLLCGSRIHNGSRFLSGTRSH